MKKLLIFLSAVTAITLALGLVSWRLLSLDNAHSTKKALTIFNWGQYIDPKLLTRFTHETGYKVNYVTFDSNEAMYEKLKQAGTSYDIVVPSDYMVQKMAAEHLLTPLDKTQIHGLNHLAPTLMNPAFDRGNTYSIPYFWGTLGIVYNDRFVKTPPTSWDDLWAPQYRGAILLTDDTRDVMGMGLMATGHSVNATSHAALDSAYQKLTQLTPNVKAILGDELMTYMTNNETPLAVVYSGQAAEMTAANPHLHYVVPTTTNVWYDNLAIAKSAKNRPAAYAFINFMLKPQNAAQNARYVGYATPNATAKTLLPASIKNNQSFYPPATALKHFEAYTNLSPYWNGVYNDLYLQFKMR